MKRLFDEKSTRSNTFAHINNGIRLRSACSKLVEVQSQMLHERRTQSVLNIYFCGIYRAYIANTANSMNRIKYEKSVIKINNDGLVSQHGTLYKKCIIRADHFLPWCWDCPHAAVNPDPEVVLEFSTDVCTDKLIKLKYKSALPVIIKIINN